MKVHIILGESNEGPHAWVYEKETNLFWESLTGECYNQGDPRVIYFYRNVHCCFNQNCYYVNI